MQLGSVLDVFVGIDILYWWPRCYVLCNELCYLIDVETPSGHGRSRDNKRKGLGGDTPHSTSLTDLNNTKLEVRTYLPIEAATEQNLYKRKLSCRTR